MKKYFYIIAIIFIGIIAGCYEMNFNEDQEYKDYSYQFDNQISIDVLVKAKELKLDYSKPFLDKKNQESVEISRYWSNRSINKFLAQNLLNIQVLKDEIPHGLYIYTKENDLGILKENILGVSYYYIRESRLWHRLYKMNGKNLSFIEDENFYYQTKSPFSLDSYFYRRHLKATSMVSIVEHQNRNYLKYDGFLYKRIGIENKDLIDEGILPQLSEMSGCQVEECSPTVHGTCHYVSEGQPEGIHCIRTIGPGGDDEDGPCVVEGVQSLRIENSTLLDNTELRSFRDQILSKSQKGKKYIEYYSLVGDFIVKNKNSASIWPNISKNIPLIMKLKNKIILSKPDEVLFTNVESEQLLTLVDQLKLIDDEKLLHLVLSDVKKDIKKYVNKPISYIKQN